MYFDVIVSRSGATDDDEAKKKKQIDSNRRTCPKIEASENQKQALEENGSTTDEWVD